MYWHVYNSRNYGKIKIEDNVDGMGGVRMDIKQRIGARTKQIRFKKGMTQQKLSERMEINSKYLSSIERGKENPTLNILIKLAESLEVHLNEIFDSTVQIEDNSKIRPLIHSLLDKADFEQLKLIFKIVSAILY